MNNYSTTTLCTMHYETRLPLSYTRRFLPRRGIPSQGSHPCRAQGTRAFSPALEHRHCRFAHPRCRYLRRQPVAHTSNPTLSGRHTGLFIRQRRTAPPLQRRQRLDTLRRSRHLLGTLRIRKNVLRGVFFCVCQKKVVNLQRICAQTREMVKNE